MTPRIIGAAMTQFGQFPDRSLAALVDEAVRASLQDAGLAPSDVGMVMFGNATEGVLRGQEMIRAEVLLRSSGLLGVPMFNVENACASSSSAFHLACMAVESGSADVVLVVGAEKLTHELKARSFGAVATAIDLAEEKEVAESIREALFESPGPGRGLKRSPLMDFYARKTATYLSAYGVDEQLIGEISVKNRLHGSLNPLAQFQKEVTLDEVMSSRMIVDPLRLLMCAPIGDGAAAVVVASEEFTRRTGRSSVAVLACASTSNGNHESARGPVTRAARGAYEKAGLGPRDIDVAEMHDACSAAELWLYDELQFSVPGGSAELIATGATRLGGRLPVNTGGGLLARGHPLGATGCAQLVELVDQLRGRSGARQVEDARVALAQTSGGILDRGDEAVCVVTILARDDL
ncbi:MAG: thiolase [Blastococcus sp.]|jgi:acetyl-CoA acetyltransferase|nr:thiolase [Blastococcus sp.]